MKAGTHKIQNTIINGSTEAVTQVVDVNMKEGRMWTESEAEHGDNVVVLGHDAAEDLFPDKSPLGQDVECEGDIFTVIGVLETQHAGQFSLFLSQDFQKDSS
jgi:putative ABC transport system permease protein